MLKGNVGIYVTRGCLIHLKLAFPSVNKNSYHPRLELNNENVESPLNRSPEVSHSNTKERERKCMHTLIFWLFMLLMIRWLHMKLRRLMLLLKKLGGVELCVNVTFKYVHWKWSCNEVIIHIEMRTNIDTFQKQWTKWQWSCCGSWKYSSEDSQWEKVNHRNHQKL